MRKHSARNRVNLLVRQKSSGTLRERGHRGSTDSIGHNAAHRIFIDNGEIHRIGKGNRRSSTPFRTMTSSAVLRVESAEVHNLIRRYCLRTVLRLTVWSAASREE